MPTVHTALWIRALPIALVALLLASLAAPGPLSETVAQPEAAEASQLRDVITRYASDRSALMRRWDVRRDRTDRIISVDKTKKSKRDPLEKFSTQQLVAELTRRVKEIT